MMKRQERLRRVVCRPSSTGLSLNNLSSARANQISLAVSIIQSPLSRNASPAQDPAAAAATHLATSPLRNKRLILDDAQVLSSQSSSGLNTQDKEDRTMIRSMVCCAFPLSKNGTQEL
jgi:hypothetical protein